MDDLGLEVDYLVTNAFRLRVWLGLIILQREGMTLSQVTNAFRLRVWLGLPGAD